MWDHMGPYGPYGPTHPPNRKSQPTSTKLKQNQHSKVRIKIQKPNPSPSVDQIGVMGGDGYEWINFPPNSQTNYYRAPGDKEWILWEN